MYLSSQLPFRAAQLHSTQDSAWSLRLSSFVSQEHQATPCCLFPKEGKLRQRLSYRQSPPPMPVVAMAGSRHLALIGNMPVGSVQRPEWLR